MKSSPQTDWYQYQCTPFGVSIACMKVSSTTPYVQIWSPRFTLDYGGWQIPLGVPASIGLLTIFALM